MGAIDETVEEEDHDNDGHDEDENYVQKAVSGWVGDKRKRKKECHPYNHIVRYVRIPQRSRMILRPQLILIKTIYSLTSKFIQMAKVYKPQMVSLIVFKATGTGFTAHPKANHCQPLPTIANRKRGRCLSKMCLAKQKHKMGKKWNIEIWFGVRAVAIPITIRNRPLPSSFLRLLLWPDPNVCAICVEYIVLAGMVLKLVYMHFSVVCQITIAKPKESLSFIQT